MKKIRTGCLILIGLFIACGLFSSVSKTGFVVPDATREEPKRVATIQVIMPTATVTPTQTLEPAAVIVAPTDASIIAAPTDAPIVVAPTDAPVAVPAANCDPAYPDFCIAPRPPDLNCRDIGRENFKVLPPDPHGFDRDGNGIGCEN